jgi:hypothetical protein
LKNRTAVRSPANIHVGKLVLSRVESVSYFGLAPDQNRVER